MGNKKITTLKPQYSKISNSCLSLYKIEADEKLVFLKKASEFHLDDDFEILKGKNFCVNVIVYHAKNKRDKSNILISQKVLGTKYAFR
jgi:hypothetical protein